MLKDFDAWNKKKQEIDALDKGMLYHEREAWWCTLGVNVGVEQNGTGTGFERPVLIIRAFSRSACLIVPLTTSMKSNPYHMSAGKLLFQESFAIISQLRLIDTRRLTEKIGYVDERNFRHIRKAAKDLL